MSGMRDGFPSDAPGWPRNRAHVGICDVCELHDLPVVAWGGEDPGSACEQCWTAMEEAWAENPERVVKTIGRWARLANGDLVTPVPSFSKMGRDEAAFNAAVERFQADPDGVIASDGIVERSRA